jgi:hypothetical protein
MHYGHGGLRQPSLSSLREACETLLLDIIAARTQFISKRDRALGALGP